MKKKIRISTHLISIVIAVGLLTSDLAGQSRHELEFLSGLGELPQEEDYKKLARGNDNEIEFLLSGAFLFYKNFISSQDGDNCSFTPSCSEYALMAIKQKGIIEGPLMFFDRYTRCNALSPENYTYIPEINRLYDPVE